MPQPEITAPPLPIVEVSAGIVNWLESVAVPAASGGPGRWRYNVHMTRNWGVESSALAVMLLWSTHALERLPSSARASIIAEIQCWQQPESGLFIDPLIRPEDKFGDFHCWEHIWQHHTGACVEALTCLQAAPLHPLPQSAFAPLQLETAREAVLSLQWNNPWIAGEQFARMIDAYLAAHPEARGAAGNPVLAEAFATVEAEILNPRTGFPDRLGCESPQVAMAGLFKILFAYLPCARALPHPERAIDSTLALQDEDGGFGWDNLCIHWDAVWTLKTLNQHLGGHYRFPDIARAGYRLAEYLLELHRKADGGFSFLRESCWPAHGSILVSDPYPESDMVGTFMAFECLRYAAAWQTGEIEVISPVELRLHRQP